MRFLAWLYPGVGVKRWLLLFSLGVALLGLGIGFALHTNVLAVADVAVSRVVFTVTGRLVAPEFLGAVAVVVGLALVIWGARGVVQSILAVVAPRDVDGLAERVYERRYLPRGPRIVALGGGTGLSTFLQGAKDYTYNVTAIVTVTDDGGSSGRLRGDLGILPPGDIRNVLVALADTEPLMETLFQHRFTRGPLADHTLGNLFIGALTESLGSFEEAVRASSRVLAVRGQILPATTSDVRLVGEFADGRLAHGESAIVSEGRRGGRLQSLRLHPESCRAVPAALEAVRDADAIILGPGSLYTSIVPNLLVPDLRAAICASKAYKIYVVNVMTQPGETDGLTASGHVDVLERYLGERVLDAVVVNDVRISQGRLAPYQMEAAEPVPPDVDILARRGLRVVAGDFATAEGLVRHDSDRLARAVMRVILDNAMPGTARLVDRVILAERLARALNRRN